MENRMIINWLESNSNSTCSVIADNSEIHFFKNSIDESLDAIYAVVLEDRYHLSSKIESNLEGIFNKEDMTLYNYGSTMSKLIGSYLNPDNAHFAMLNEFKKQVLLKEHSYIRQLETTLLEDLIPDKAKEPYKNMGATMAQTLYLTNKELKPKYYSKYECGSFHNVAVRYILDKESLIEDVAKERFKNNRSDIEREIYIYKYAVKEMERLCSGADKNMMAMKKVMNSIPNYYCNVNVTVNMNQSTYTFKVWASNLSKYFYGGMGVEDINHEYQEEYIRIFGENAKFRPIDITAITHGKSILYQRDTWIQSKDEIQENEEETFVLGM